MTKIDKATVAANRETSESSIVPHELYIDGSYKPNTERGGWAFVCVGQTKEGHPLQRGARSGAETDSTHNRMKLKAALEGLLFCKGSGVSHATVVSNSDYLIDGMNGQATVWRNRGWRNKSGLVPNVDLWEELLNISGHISVNWGRSYGDVSGWAAMAKQLAKEQRIDEDLI